MKYDLVVIGGGPAGYSGAIYAAKRGMNVALIEKQSLGGTCLNKGCIPTKALLHSSALYAASSEWAGIGLKCDNISFHQNAAYGHKDNIVETLKVGIRGMLKTSKIALYEGCGAFIDEHSVRVSYSDSNKEDILESEYFLIATGSYASVLPIKGAGLALNSDDVLQNPVEGERIVIIGGGVIGTELASYFSDIGRGVTIIEAEERILSGFSKEITSYLSSLLKKKGVRILTRANIERIESNCVIAQTEEKQESIECDSVLCTVGRRACTDGLGLENTGVRLTRGAIEVNVDMQTSVGNIYAAGDVTGALQLAHFAQASAERAVEQMLGLPHNTDMGVVPVCVYASLEIAVVGDVTNPDTASAKYLLGGNGKYLINGSNRGFIRVYYNDKGIVCGAELVGKGVSELTGELACAIRNRLRLKDIAGTIHAHPTVNESIREACADCLEM